MVARRPYAMIQNLLTFLIYGVCAIAIAIPFLVYQKKLKVRETKAREAEEKGKTYSSGPLAQYPHIDTVYCIGCAICTHVCPEGDVLAMLGGKAVIVNGHKCIGHSLCAEACPVGARRNGRCGTGGASIARG